MPRDKDVPGTESRLSSRGVALAAVALAVIGAALIFGGRDDETHEPGAAPSGDPQSPSHPLWSPLSRDDRVPWPPVPGGNPRPTPEASPEPSGTPTSRASGTPAPTSASVPPTEAPPDPHSHGLPTAEEAENAPTPEIDHDFVTDVSRDLAEQILAVAWPWLRQRLESDGLAHLKVIDYGVEETASDNSAAVVEVGYSFSDGYGLAGGGRVATVWLEAQPAGSWKVTGFRHGARRDDG